MGLEKLVYKDLKPAEIEAKSMEIIRHELEAGGITLPEREAPVILRAIHTSADFDYAKNMFFSKDAVIKIEEALRNGACIVTDTQMTKSGINAKALSRYGCEVFCFMSDEDIMEASAATGRTRASLSMDKAADLKRDTVFAIGNAPTALIRLYELVMNGVIEPKGIIAIPVGFVNVTEAKELITELQCPHIVTRGRKGGSNVCAAVVNALLYDL